MQPDPPLAGVPLADWWCAAAPAGAVADPAGLAAAELEWLPAAVPGTAAAALLGAGKQVADRDLDAEDWWWRCALPVLSGDGDARWRLRFDGVATSADVWVGGVPIARSENMFVPFEAELPAAELSARDLVVRCAALTGAPRRPRPRWKTRLVADQSLRWRRTTLIGRIPGWAPGPAPVGPWRGVTLAPVPAVRVVERRLLSRYGLQQGVVRVQARLRVTGPVPQEATVRVSDTTSSVPLTVKDDDVLIDADVVVPGIERWWPHTHGSQPLYPVSLSVAGDDLPLGRVGFRDIDVETADGGFCLKVNGTTVFARGACWLPLDAVTLASPADEMRRTLAAAREAGCNLIRVAGTGVYPDAAFRDACDELGLLVWQDLMLANMDPPDDDDFAAGLMREVTFVAREWQPHPSLAVVCGSSEVEQQATYFGLPPARRQLPLLTEAVPDVLAGELPDVPYLPSSPTGGALPTRLRAGVTHYFGVGAYLRPLADVRTAGVRFAAECLAFAVPAEGARPEQLLTPAWERGTPRDSLPEDVRSWDFEDVTAHYVGELYGVDASRLRSANPLRYVDLSRAAVCEAMTHVFAEWRRPGSGCAGGIVLTLRDLVPGPGWGLLDCTGAPKAPWWALTGLLAPVAVFTTDEGLDGIAVHVLNDTALTLDARLVVEILTPEGHVTDVAAVPVTVPPAGGVSLDVEGEVIGCFRDINGAHRFGPVPDGCLVARLESAATDGIVLAEWTAPLAGPGRPVGDIGLAAAVSRVGNGWEVELTAQRFAERLILDVPGWRPARNWFHLPAGRPAVVPLLPVSGGAATGGPPRGEVRAVNARHAAPLG